MLDYFLILLCKMYAFVLKKEVMLCFFLKLLGV